MVGTGSGYGRLGLDLDLNKRLKNGYINKLFLC
jgi:hypothetical protein